MGYRLREIRGLWFCLFPEGGQVACAALEGENKLARHRRESEVLHA